jgi:[protein-PII] uridylyltransferase
MTYLITQIDVYKPVDMDPLDHERFLPELVLSSSDTVTADCKTYLDQCYKKVEQLMEHGFTAMAVHAVRSKMIDRLVINLFVWYETELANSGKIKKGSYALLATGGYGRQEMSLLSDIDLLVLYESGKPDHYQAIMEKLLYVLWDLKLDVGHALRKLSECRELMKDQTIFTSLLDLRLLYGSKSLFDKLGKVRHSLAKNNVFLKKYFHEKFDERSERLRKYGGSVYLLEPNLKEGEGGLRDIHLIRWFGQVLGMKTLEDMLQAGYLDKEMMDCLQNTLDFFLTIRNRLHMKGARKNDQLGFDFQISIAKEMGFVDDETGILGVEKFMQAYYTFASQIDHVLSVVVHKMAAKKQNRFSRWVSRIKAKKLDQYFKIVDGQIAATSSNVFEKHPNNLMKIFCYVQETACPIHFETKGLINRYLYLVDDDFRTNEENRATFKQIMSEYKNLGTTLFAMHAVHFFDRFIPEFRKIRNRMQHDAYHVYTVDTHSIFALNDLSKLLGDEKYLQKFPLYRKAMLAAKRPDLLTLGLLFHDIGKGEGGNHSVIGAEIANQITARLGYSKEDQEVVEFLVLSHLLMAHLSQRRDIDDPQLIYEFARSMRNVDYLNMLYVLTWADIRAVSAEAWTDWKGHLLTNLYTKTKELLSGEELTREMAIKRVHRVREDVLKRMKEQVDEDELKQFLESISQRYVLSHSDKEILEHFNLIKKHDDSQLLFEARDEQSSISKVLIYTLSNPRILPLITGVMLALDINVLSMEAFSLTDGHVFIEMQVQSRYKECLQKAGLVALLEKTLNEVFLGKNYIEDLIAKRKRPKFMVKKPVQKADTKIAVDNDVSAYYTVIDVFAHDRLGILYDIINTLVQHGCYVEVSKISTKVEQIVDSFYIKDIFGHKILAKKKLSEIKDALMKVIDEDGEFEQQAG